MIGTVWPACGPQSSDLASWLDLAFAGYRGRFAAISVTVVCRKQHTRRTSHQCQPTFYLDERVDCHKHSCRDVLRLSLPCRSTATVLETEAPNAPTSEQK